MSSRIPFTTPTEAGTNDRRKASDCSSSSYSRRSPSAIEDDAPYEAPGGSGNTQGRDN